MRRCRPYSYKLVYHTLVVANDLHDQILHELVWSKINIPSILVSFNVNTLIVLYLYFISSWNIIWGRLSINIKSSIKDCIDAKNMVKSEHSVFNVNDESIRRCQCWFSIKQRNTQRSRKWGLQTIHPKKNEWQHGI